MTALPGVPWILGAAIEPVVAGVIGAQPASAATAAMMPIQIFNMAWSS
jgi:hypothetical protein